MTTMLFEPTYQDLKQTPIGEWITVLTQHGYSYLNIRGKGCMISLAEEPSNINRGTFHATLDILDLSQMSIDHNDGWSVGRYYFDLDRAKAEVEAWLRAWNQLDEVSDD